MSSADGSVEMGTLVRHARELRERIWRDPHRPRYHLMPPEGFVNDANGAIYWNGRYHVFYLARSPIPDPDNPGADRWVEVWDHVSSTDLVRWTYHPPALRPRQDGSTPNGIWSGGAVRGAPEPTLVYYVPGQGICLAVAEDDDLIRWRELDQNPVIPADAEGEFVVYDPGGWYEDGTYRLLVGNRNNRPGYEGDCTSLFVSRDLVDWQYEGPFYQSRREWTDLEEDAACPEFYPIGDRHMLLFHGHRPYMQCHYYLGRYVDGRFEAESHGRMNWPGGQLGGPEALTDAKGRVVFFGWVYEAAPDFGWGRWMEKGWAGAMTLPRILSVRDDGTLGITPAPELESLRHRPRSVANVSIPADGEVDLPEMAGDTLELSLTIDPGQAEEVGVKVRCAPGESEETCIVYLPAKRKLRIELMKSTLDPHINYGVPAQTAPLTLNPDEPLDLRVFLDRSIMEVYANGRQCMTQRVYPTHADSLGARLLARGGAAKAVRVDAWDMNQAAPW